MSTQSGTPVPYGYQRSKTVPSLLLVNTGEQAVVRRIVRERQAGAGLREICRILADAKITCRGGPWYHSTVRAILRRAGC